MKKEETTYSAQSGCLAQLGCFLLLALLTILFFWPVLTGEKAFWGDVVAQDFPWRNFAATQIQQGNIPLWNPHNYAGMPFLADVQSAVLYPLNLILAFFVQSGRLSFYALQCQIIFHFFLAGIFMFALLRHFRLKLFSSLTGAVSFMFTGFLVAHLGHVGMLNVAVWAPLVFLFFHKALTERRWSSALLGGFFFGISILAGHSQPALYLVFAMTLYLLYHTAIEAKRSSRPLSCCVQLFSLFGLMMLTTFAVGAAQILPMAELTQFSVRAQYGFEHATSYSLPPKHLITLLIPKFFGMPHGGTYSYWGADNFTEMCIYAGLVPMILALVGVFRRRNRETIFFMALSVIALLLAMGKYTFFYHVVYEMFPLVAKVRIPARFGFLSAFAISILAAFGSQALLEPVDEKTVRTLRRIIGGLLVIAFVTGIGIFILYSFMLRDFAGEENYKFSMTLDQTVLFLVLLFAAILTLFVRKNRVLSARATGAAILILVVVDLFLFGFDYNLSSTKWADIEEREEPTVSYLRSETGIERLEVHDGLSYNVGTMYGLYQDTGWNPFRLASFDQFQVSINPKDRFRYLLGVKFLISQYDLATPEYRKVEGIRFDTSYMEQVGPDYNPEFEISNLQAFLSDGIAMVTDLGYAVQVPQGEKVGELIVETLSGKRHTFPIRAGVESSDWACDHAEVVPLLQHRRAEVAWEFTRGDISARTFFSRYELPELDYLKRIVVVPLHPEAVINVHGFSLLDSGSEQSEPIATGHIRFDRKFNDIKVFRTRTYLPRAVFVHEVEWASDFSEALKMVQEQAFSLKEKVILTNSTDVPPSIPVATGVDETVQVGLYEPDEVVIRVNANAPGVLVLSDMNYPGWQAFLNGVPAELLEANGVMRGVAVPAGHHLIEMKFRPKSFQLGTIISLLALLFLLIFAVIRLSGRAA